ncbi:MAG: beta-lactamase family protein [Puniceicoccales bacterium]|nr:beta-lactamase family protein [Puniceicoccales bacterium]
MEVTKYLSYLRVDTNVLKHNMLHVLAFLCVLFSVACSNIHKTNLDNISEVEGIVAVKDADQSVKLKFCSKGIDLNTPFLIGSVSKQFTAILAIKHLKTLFNTEIITLITDDEFQAILKNLQETEVIPFWPQLKLQTLKGTTIHDLLMHSATIDYATGERINRYKYHNLNYALVGKCLEKQTKRSYTELAHDLFVEAGMTNTFLHDDFSEKELWTKLQKALVIANCSPQKLKNPLTTTMNPAGGAVSTARDLLRWNEFLHQNKCFDVLTKATVPIGDGNFYGLGIITNKNKSLFWHTGAIVAVFLEEILFTCVLIYDMSQARSFVGFDVANITDVTCNSEDTMGAKIDERVDMLVRKCVK